MRARYVDEWFTVRGTPLTTKTTSEWLEIFRNGDIAAMPCHTLETLLIDPHLTAVGLIEYEEHPAEGQAAVIRPSIKIDGLPLSPRAPAAPRGWDTNDILRETGFCTSEVDDLLSEGAAYSSPERRSQVAQ
jgi:crotonobetainyl-CoA:carnitine CoA-transferase CaiB-like acyl-CoA transferase